MAERSPFLQFLHQVKRSRTDQRIGGVCGGLAAYSDVPAWVYRALFIALLITGVSAVVYVALWICMPVEPLEPSTAPMPMSGDSANAAAVQ